MLQTPTVVQTRGDKPPTATELAYAGFWLRAVALVIDAIVINVALMMVNWVTGFIPVMLFSLLFFVFPVMPDFGGGGFAGLGMAALGGYLLFSFMAAWIYYAAMESSEFGGTIGKHVVGLKVVNQAGARLDFGHATGRYFARLVSVSLLFSGFLLAGWTERKQALHDIIAGTLVVKVPRL